MQTNLLLVTLCLLGSVILCGGQSSTYTSIPSTAITPETPADSSTASQLPPTDDSNPTSSTKPPLTSTSESTSESIPGTTDEGATPQPSSGLSSGAIAGIAVGSVAGVALLGGGVFGLLKYTKKI